MRTHPEYSFRLIGDALSTPDPVESLQVFIAEQGLLKTPPDVLLSRLTPQAINLFLVHQLLREVLGGGFSTFFTNASGVFSCETLVALHELKAPITAQLLADLLAVFPSSQPPKERMPRYTLVESLGKDFMDKCIHADAVFYDKVDTHKEQDSRPESLWKLSFNYMRDYATSPIMTGEENCHHNQ